MATKNSAATKAQPRTLAAATAPAATASLARDLAHSSSNPHPKPPIKDFIESPNHSSRNGTRIDMVVLHCTEGSLASTIATFSNPGGRQVSAHYVIDRNGDIIQMVRDSDRANHCRGANQNSIGIEHVGTETQALATPQASASAKLQRWLLEQYDIPPARIFGHDFAPGHLTDTSCPDKLFGAAHTQATVTAWVTANVVNG